MIVIADTTPINYLILIDQVHILPELYGRVVIPQAVFEELSANAAPLEVKKWLANFPEWIEIGIVSSEIDAELAEMLDQGESEAIRLAEELDADLLIIDDKVGREIAARRGLQIVGTVGVLALASQKNLINVEEIIQKLEKTNFYISPELKEILRESKTN